MTVVILLVEMFTKYTQIINLYFAEGTSISEQVNFVIFLLHSTTVFIKLGKSENSIVV